MNDKEAIASAKRYLAEVYADEQIVNLGLEEFEPGPGPGQWTVTLSFSRPWNTPRTRAQEVLENLGAVSSLQRAYKMLTIADDGTVLSLKTRPRREPAE